VKDSNTDSNKYTRRAAIWTLGLCFVPAVWSIIALGRPPRAATRPEPAPRAGSHVFTTVAASSATARRPPRQQAARPTSNAQVQAIDAGPDDVAWSALSTVWDSEALDRDWSQNMTDYVNSLVGVVAGGRTC
jgi:hypothetical protein